MSKSKTKVTNKYILRIISLTQIKAALIDVGNHFSQYAFALFLSANFRCPLTFRTKTSPSASRAPGMCSWGKTDSNGRER